MPYIPRSDFPEQYRYKIKENNLTTTGSSSQFQEVSWLELLWADEDEREELLDSMAPQISSKNYHMSENFLGIHRLYYKHFREKKTFKVI